MKYPPLTQITLLSTLLFVFSILSINAQDIPAILAIQEIDTMFYSGPKDNRINWVIQNRGDSFTDKDDFTTLYKNDLLKTFELGHVLEQAPYAQYRNFFNLYTFWWPDAPDDDNGWTFGIIKALRDLVFLPWANEETGWATFFSSTKYGGGGGAGLDRDARVGDGKMYGMGFETFLHEFGHTMPGLLDEYSASGSWSNSQCWETPNTTGQLQIDNIPWRLWIEPGTPIPTPYTEEYLDKFGAFEGAMTNYFGCHRPTARGCFMGAGGFGEDYGLVLCSPCIQRVICYLYKYVNVIENPLPASNNLTVTGTETITFSVDVVKPEPNTQQYKWILNGEVIATNAETVDVTFGSCDSYELIFSVTDTNTLVRYDPKFEDTYPKPYREKLWTINQSDVSNYSLESTQQIQDADCSGDPTGMVDFTISGGQPPYVVYLNTTVVSNPVTSLAAGDYQFDIVDANGCNIVKEINIGEYPFLDPQICSELIGTTWTLSVEDINYNNNDLTFLWFTGETSPSISNLEDGNYSVQVTTSSGCATQKSISLDFVDNTLTVDHTIIPTELDKPTGKIYLDIRQGKAPYTIEWLEKINRDLTDTNISNILFSGTTWDHEPEFAFDDNLSTKWLHAISNNAYIGYQFPSAVVVNYYAITSADDVPERDPKDWEFQGSTDGTSWVTLDQQTNHLFDDRFERRGFLFDNTTPYIYYRLFVNQNHGDIATQIQELEIIGADLSAGFEANDLFRNESRRTNLAAGFYHYIVKDANLTAYSDTLQVTYAAPFTALDLVVVQDGDCQVAIEIPNPDFDYYWFPDKEASNILHIGNTFQPESSGNYYVAALNLASGAMSTNIKGFAVSVAEMPEVEAINDTDIGIVDPNPDMVYQWYDQYYCGNPIHVGNTFTPSAEGYYYVSALTVNDAPAPIDPTTISGLVIRMDASDLNGDEVIDNPPPPTSSLYGWDFSNGNSWADGNWYAFRSNYQNGLGIADFATIWLQRIQNSENGYQTILMAYEENPISFPERAPFEGLSENIPRHSDASQLYSNNAPPSTLGGTTYLNGEIVNPLATANPMEFCILGTVMTEVSNEEIFYTDTHWEGKIGELILYDKALTSTEMKGASEYLRKKWISVADLESPRRVLHWDGMALDIDSELHQEENIIIYPNPTFGQFQINGLEGTYTIQILDRSGKNIQSFITKSGTIDLHDLSEGLYFVKMVSEDRSTVFVRKVMKM